MMPLDIVLAVGSLAAMAGWAGISLFVLYVARRRRSAHATINDALSALADPTLDKCTIDERLERIRPILAPASRELILRAAVDGDTPSDARAVLLQWLITRWGLETLEHDARAHRTRREKWRRTAALQALDQIDAARSLPLLRQAVEEADLDVAGVALSLLGRSTQQAAADVLLDALKNQRQPGSRVAVQLDRCPHDLSARLLPLLADADAAVRLWAATLLARYPDVDGLEYELAVAAEDVDPRVRKAAVQSLGVVGDRLAAATATRLLSDPVAYVRATAARTIGRLDRIDLAEEIVPLLGDENWWVRFAAKECLETMGSEVWPVLARSLEHEDRFVRNGAAEVFQNLGVLDSFILMEAASDNPGDAKIEMLRRIVLAGGLRLTDSLVERTGAFMGARVRDLLATIGLQQVGA